MRQDGILKIRISDDLAARFKFAAKKSGTTQSAALRQLMTEYVEVCGWGAPGNYVEESKKANQQLNLRISSKMKKDISERALTDGFSAAAWVRNLIQTALTREPVSTERECIELAAAWRHLSAVGRNLNQVARAFNYSEKAGTKFSVEEKIRLELLQEINQAVEEVKQKTLVLRNRRYEAWLGDDE